LRGEPILIVDDNAVNLKLVRLLLAAEGYDVRAATDADDALAALADFHPWLILMDLRLPGVDGLELTRRLRVDPVMRVVVVVALTAYAMRGDDERALAAGCDGYLTKPIETRMLPAAVAAYLDVARMRRGLPPVRRSDTE
jgi:CheY-like chemotaxis protein